MFKIRKIHDDLLPVNREIIAQAQQILRTRFNRVPEEEIAQIGEKLRNPFKHRFRTILLVAENLRRRISGFAMLLHEPEIGFCYLDWIALAGGNTGGGIGSALYDRVRREAAALGAGGLFFETLPDDPQTCPDETILKQNRSRLRFYEQYGARPIVNTGYETPVKAADTCMPYLVYDGLDRPQSLRLAFARKVARAILERKYADYCPPDYVVKVVASFRDDPVRLRPLRYVKPEAVQSTVDTRVIEPVALIINDKHTIHHVHERGYVESPVRVRSIRSAIEPSGMFTISPPRAFGQKHITAVHDVDLVNYLRRACAEMPEGKSLYPYVFPIRNKTRPPKEPSVLSGYYCIDTFTPINHNAYPAARRGVDCALTAAAEILTGRRIAYALVRPPGHHAERRAFGGFCYFNNNAIAAHYLSAHGRVAILDIDYHHGNGQQDIFYRRSDVLTISIHGHPRFAYPYFTGFEDENGEGEGEGFNWNLPLPESVDGPQYRKALKKSLERIEAFKPHFLIVALGLDTARGDPTGSWQLLGKDFETNGRMIGELGLPTLVVQEGGYRTRTLGTGTLNFFKGLVEASNRALPLVNTAVNNMPDLHWRHAVQAGDPERIRSLVAATGFFNPEEIGVAEELVQERLTKGAPSGYCFLIAEYPGRMAGYTCYGPIAGSSGSFDLYWIAVHPDFQRRGMGRRLIQETERLIYNDGGRRIYIETSQRTEYASTRIFYENCGYRLEASLKDFYAPGDSKAIYCKTLD
ncbi:MAG: GNAT family N-acetyltransferase [Desulfobacteraceae bacterium]|nr:MAG: GNAT family N-acetyltransferase [Desulfobacteraceae bacterium]